MSTATVIRARGLGKRFEREYGPSHGHLRDRIGARMSRGNGHDDRAPREVTWALRDVDLDVEKGQILGVIGRNGSGKTTLLSILARVTAPTEGEAEIHGRVAPLLQVGAGFHPQLTGRDNIVLSSAIGGMTPEETAERMGSIIEFSEVGDHIDQPVKHYSSGMYVRLAYSVAAFMPAEIMLVDEVLSVGDAAFKRKSEAHMREALRDGRTVLYVGHDLDLIREISDSALVLDAGRIVFRGTGPEAAEHYEREIVKLAPKGRDEGR